MPLDPRIIALSQKHAAELTALIVDIARENIAGKTTVKREVRRSAKPTRGSCTASVRVYLTEHPWTSMRDISEALDLPYDRLNGILQAMRRRGEVQRRGTRRKYKYALALRIAGKVAA